MSSVLFLAPAFARAQQDQPLPDAPSPVASAVPAPQSSGEEVPIAAMDAETLAGIDEELPPLTAPKPSEFHFESAAAEDSFAFDSGGVKIAQGGHLDLTPLFAAMSRPPAVSGVLDGATRPERYHTGQLLWQSLAFLGAEESWRLFTDTNLRHLISDNPYWHNYIASLKQWNMRRWWDGDSFLVDYIGHPMQGGVSSYIEIQNSPRQRKLRINDGREYWRSRFLGMMWATVFSTQQKVGPLGEAALGSDGGITYPLNCPYPCKSYKPGVTKYTNNTGWTDFISTPVIGTFWVLIEDFIDLEVSDRVQHGDLDAVFPKIVRGALNPCRTMANVMRWRKPWYRDFQDGTENLHMTRAIHFLPNEDEVVKASPRFEIFPHFNAISLPVNTTSCSHCRKLTTGSGVGFSARFARWAEFDSDFNYQPNASPNPSDRVGGNITLATFGLRSGFQNQHYALKAAIRPGLLSYDHAYESSPSNTDTAPPAIGRITHFTTALAISGDYYFGRHVGLRAVFGNTPVRYREAQRLPPGVGKPPYLGWLSKEQFLTNANWSYQTGAVLRF